MKFKLKLIIKKTWVGLDPATYGVTRQLLTTAQPRLENNFLGWLLNVSGDIIKDVHR